MILEKNQKRCLTMRVVRCENSDRTSNISKSISMILQIKIFNIKFRFLSSKLSSFDDLLSSPYTTVCSPKKLLTFEIQNSLSTSAYDIAYFTKFSRLYRFFSKKGDRSRRKFKLSIPIHRHNNVLVKREEKER